jgi:hypothetical protein
MEGVTSGQDHAIYLVDDTDEGALTVYRRPVTERDGRVFVMIPLRGSEDRLIVTAGGSSFDPDGERVLEAAIPQVERQESIGSA